jgi:hypothetical protein
MWQAGGDDLSFGQYFHLNNSYIKANAELNFLSEFVVCGLFMDSCAWSPITPNDLTKTENARCHLVEHFVKKITLWNMVILCSPVFIHDLHLRIPICYRKL